MKLKRQPPLRRRGGPTRQSRSVRGRARSGGGRQARRPGVPLRRRVAARLPSIRRFIAGLGAVAGVAALVALLNGPWLRITEVAWAGTDYTDAGAIEELLEERRGVSALAVDTRLLEARIELLPAVADASVAVSLTGSIEATVVEHQAAFVWETRSVRLIGAADGVIFAGGPVDNELDPSLAGLPRIRDLRFAARVATVGDTIPEALVRTALRLAELDPALLGSNSTRLTIRLDDEFGFRLVSAEQEWQVALGVYGLDPRETVSSADARLERQITAVRTLFATHPETEVRWVDVRNPGKVYFRAKG